MSDRLDESTMSRTGEQVDAFALKDCALIAIATGKKALTLKELRDQLHDIDSDSIFLHFWGNLLQPRFEEREYNNDLASWARRGLHDDALAERLAIADPTEFANIEELRQELLDIMDERLDESEHLSWVRATEAFEFIRSQIVVFDTYQRIERPEKLAELLPKLSTSSIFYHFIDARRRTPERIDDFRYWLSSFHGLYDDLSEQLADIDLYFSTLTQLRQQLTEIFSLCCQGARA